MLLQFKITVFYFNTFKNVMHFFVNHENFYVREHYRTKNIFSK